MFLLYIYRIPGPILKAGHPVSRSCVGDEVVASMLYTNSSMYGWLVRGVTSDIYI